MQNDRRPWCKITDADPVLIAVPSASDVRFIEIVACSGDIPPLALDITIPVEYHKSWRAEAIGADFSIDSAPGSGTWVVVEVHRGG